MAITESSAAWRQLVARIARLEETQEQRLRALEERDSKVEGRVGKLEESLQRALNSMMPKVEELLGHQRSLSSSTQAPSLAAPTSRASDSVPRTAQDEESSVGAPMQDTSGDPASTTIRRPAASLHEAAQLGDVAALRRFLAGGGANVGARDNHGNTALHLAALNGSTESVDALIASGAPVDKRGNQSRTPLHCAAARGHLAIVERLVGAAAGASVEDALGATAIDLAAREGHPSVVQWLFEQGPTLQGTNKDVVLLHAAYGGNKQTVKYLLEKGASPTVKDTKGNSSLFLASKDGHADILDDLLKVVDINYHNSEIERCLCAARNAGVVWSIADAARELVLGPAGQRALREAASSGRQEALAALLQVGVTVNAISDDWFKRSALHKAASQGHASCVRLLLEAGAQMNFRCTEGSTPLMYAAFNGKIECIVALMESGADAAVINGNGKTALDIAQEKGYANCVQEIQRRMGRTGN